MYLDPGWQHGIAKLGKHSIQKWEKGNIPKTSERQTMYLSGTTKMF